MTKLEQEIFDAVNKCYADATETEAKSAAGAVISWLRTAFQDGQASVNTKYGEFDQNFEEWANENGII